jgi:hypothetical protein
MYCVIPEEAAFSPSAAALVKFMFEDDREGTSGYQISIVGFF